MPRSLLCHPLRLLATVCALLALSAAPASAGMANAGIPGAPAGNPLAGMRWGVYHGTIDGLWTAYLRSGGEQRRLLAKEALRPSVYWFGAWDWNSTAGPWVRQFIDSDGGPNVLTQIAVFRVNPWEGQACSTLPDASAASSYRQWIDGFANGIGNARVALILQPDLPFALCAPGGSTAQLDLVAYAARRFSELPHTTVYIDAGAQDWESVGQAVWLLQHAGVRYARGFSLNDTHFDSTGNELLFGAAIARWLGARGISSHFVISTAMNGAPFKYYEYHGADKGNVHACPTRGSTYCATLGIPPTTDVANPRWGLAPNKAAIARRMCDAYLWVGRPWLDYGSYPFDLSRALMMAASTPF